MPQSFKLRLPYRVAECRFVKEQMQVFITTTMPLSDEHVADICTTVLAQALKEQRYITHYAVMNFEKLLFLIQRVKINASGRRVNTGLIEVLKATLRPECQGTEPRSRSLSDFEFSAVLPETRALLKAVWALAARCDDLDR